MRRIRSKSIDIQLSSGNQPISINWKRTILCGVYSDEMSSSIFYTRKQDEHFGSMPEGVNQELMEMNSVKRISMKCLNSLEKIRTMRLMKQASERKVHRAESLLHRLKVEADEETAKPPVLFTVKAIRNCVPSPYDKEALRFKEGDLIEVTGMSETGRWRGSCCGREGYFKFVDVSRRRNQKRRPDKESKKFSHGSQIQRPSSVSDLLAEISLDNLTPLFVLNGYDSIEEISTISDDTLDYLGIEDDVTRNLLIEKIKEFSEEEYQSTDDCLTSDSSDEELSNSLPNSFLYHRWRPQSDESWSQVENESSQSQEDVYIEITAL